MLLLRGATGNSGNGTKLLSFNTCSSCEEQLPKTVPAFDNQRFNTCSSCEEQLEIERKRLQQSVSIHAPLARSNPLINLLWRVTLFQYMLLLRGATMYKSSCALTVPVSIHAPLARSNYYARFIPKPFPSFNTCSSCEEQHCSQMRESRGKSFNTCSSCEEQLLWIYSRCQANCFNTCSSCEEQQIYS